MAHCKDIDQIREEEHPETELDRAIWQILRESAENIIYQTSGDRTEFVLSTAREKKVVVAKSRCGYVYFAAMDFLRRQVLRGLFAVRKPAIIAGIKTPRTCLSDQELELAATCYKKILGILRTYWRDSVLANKILNNPKSGRN